MKLTKKFETLEIKVKYMQISLRNKDTEIKDIKEKHDVLEASFKKLQEGYRDLEERCADITHCIADLENSFVTTN